MTRDQRAEALEAKRRFWRQHMAEAIAEREQINASSVRGKVNHFLRVAGIKRGERQS